MKREKRAASAAVAAPAARPRYVKGRNACRAVCRTACLAVCRTAYRAACRTAYRAVCRTACLAVCLAAGLSAGMYMQAFAGPVTVNWDDLTDAQQEQAYLQLESENKALREELARLKGEPAGSTGTGSADGGPVIVTDGSQGGGPTDGSQGGGSSDGSQSTTEPAGGSGGVDSGAAAAQPGSAQSGSTQTFLADLAASFNARQEKARTYTTAEVNAMSETDMWNFRFACAEEERAFYDAYHGAQLDDLNILYLCSEYCLGLEKQFQAKEIWNTEQNSEEANRLYTAGYYNRAYALVELCEYYGLDLADEYQNLKNAVAKMDSMSSDETRNAAVDPEKVKQVQELLNSLGFLCGEPDGIAGRQTASCIERFQMMYGYEPADGIIDDELIAQMSGKLADRQG